MSSIKEEQTENDRKPEVPSIAVIDPMRGAKSATQCFLELSIQ